MNACRNVISEIESLKISLTKDEDQNYYNEIKLGREVVGDFIEILEQTINSTLLSMIIKVFTLAHLPLDKLIVAATVDSDDASIDGLVNSFDEHTDAIFQIAHFSTLCCSDKKRSQAINSSLHFMEALEKEIVPATLRIKPNTHSDGIEERNHLRCLRQLWKNEVDSLEESLMNIVDPTAYCLMAERELSSCAKLIHDSAYTQDSELLRPLLMKLVKISKSIIDFSWKIQKDSSKNEDKIEDNNPMVKAERAIWELEAASVQTLKCIDDLNLHKSLLKRIQVMATAIHDLTKYLLNEESKETSSSSSDEMPVSMIKILKNESTISRTASLNKYESRRNDSKGQKSPVKVLTSVSRIIIGEDHSTSIIYDNKLSNEPEKVTDSYQAKTKEKIESYTPSKSFRKIALKSAMKNRANQTRKCINPVTFNLADQTVERLSQSVEPLMPFTTRARQESYSTTANSIYYTPKSNITNNHTVSNSKKIPLSVPNEFDLSQILNKLTQLSHELSISLQNSDEMKLEDEPLGNQDASEIIIKETEELKSINDSIASVSLVRKELNPNEKTTTTKAIIENDIGSSPLLSERRKPLKSIGNKNKDNSSQSIFMKKSDLKLKINDPLIIKKEIVKAANKSNRAMDEISRYKLENDIYLSTPERRKDLEKMEQRVAALLDTNS